MQESEPESKFVITAMTPVGWRTLKSMNEEFLEDEELDDYYKGKVKDDSKFKTAESFQITRFGNKKIKKDT
jgi:hypothetical protein